MNSAINEAEKSMLDNAARELASVAFSMFRRGIREGAKIGTSYLMERFTVHLDRMIAERAAIDELNRGR